MHRLYIKFGKPAYWLFLLGLAAGQIWAGPMSASPPYPLPKTKHPITRSPQTAPPNWSVDPDAYEFNMNAVIRLQYTGLPSNNPGNLVAAFVGSELRGVAAPVVIGGVAHYFLTIYSNTYTGETVHFKAYYAPDDAVYGAFEAATFIHNLYLGTSELPYSVNIDPNADFPPELSPILADTTLQGIPFDPIVLGDYLYSADGDPVTWTAQPGPNLSVGLVNGVLTVTPVSNSWIGTDSVRIIVTENTAAHLADTVTARFTVLEDYGVPVWQPIPGQSIFTGQTFSSFDLDDYLDYDGPCRGFDFNVFPFTGSTPDPAWPVLTPGTQPMNIIARPLFADIQMAGSGSRLAAFVGGNLAGWANPSGAAPNVSYHLVLKNVGTGVITYRFYDAARQYMYEEPSSLLFTPGGSVGTVASPYALQLSPLIPALNANGVFSLAIDDPAWVGNYPIDFIVWDCDYPDLRRDTFQAVFSIVPDTRPEISSSSSVNFEENACAPLYDTQTSDPNFSEGMGLTYALAGGADAGRFSIAAQTGILNWAPGFHPDYENPADADGNNQYEVKISVLNTAGLSDTLALTVTVTNQAVEPFAATINNGASLICTPASVTLQANGGPGYTWSTGSTQSSILVSAPGTYTVTVTSSGACTASATVLVAPPPSIVAAGSNGPVCIGANIQLSSTPSGGTAPYAAFVWSGPNSYSANVEDPAAFPAVPAAAGLYTVILTDAAGCTATAGTTISVSGNSAPQVAAGSNSPICAGASLSLNASASGGSGTGYTYLWAGPNNYAALGSNPAPFMATPASAGAYFVTVTDGAGCKGSTATTVQVNAKPSAVAGSNSPVSVGGTIQLSSSASGGSGSGFTYQWSGPNNFSSTQAQPAGFAASQGASGVYTVTLTDSNGCSGTSTTTVSVVACPTITASVSGAACVGSTLLLQSAPAGGATPYAAFAWSGPNNYSAAVEDPAGFTATMSSNGLYTVTVTDLLGCTATASVNVAVNPSPAITAQNNGPHCAGATALVSSSPSGGTAPYSFLWTGPDFFGATVEDPPSFTATAAASGVYQVKVTDVQGCMAIATTTLVVHAKPSLTASNNGPLCLGAPLSLQSTPSGGSGNYASFLWAGPASYSSTLEDPTPFAVTLAHAGTYTVTVTDNQGCSNTASTIVSVSNNNAPSITATSNSPVCGGNQLGLASTPTAGTPPYTAFSWAGPNGYSASQEDPPAFIVFQNGAGTYAVTVTDSKNCKATATVAVTVTSPSINPTSNSPVCPGAAIQLHAGGPSGSGVTYSWSGPNNFSSNLSDPNIANATSSASGIYTVTVNDNGCVGTASTTVSVSDALPPSITCPANTTLAANAACSSPLGAYSALSVSDNCAANPAVTQSPAASTLLNGHNDVKTVTLTANDGNGNTQSCSFTVTLKDVTAPSISCPANTTLAANANCSGVLGTYAPLSLSDNCVASPTVTQSPASTTLLSGHNDVKTVTLTANDGNGNTQSCTFTVTLKDVTPPGISCPANTTLAADASCSSLLGAYSPVTLSDNCAANPAVTQSPAASTLLSGHNDVEMVTLSANDGNGNTQSCTFTVTLKDVTAPVIACPANTTLAANAGCSSPLGAYLPAAVSDNCTASPAVTQSPAAATLLSGHNDLKTVTLTASDGNGNTQSCSFTVTLKDVTAPVIACPANTTIAANANCSGVLGSYAPVSVSDNCTANPAVTQSPAPTTVLSGHNDSKTVTLTANDGNGNTQSCFFTVTLKDITPPNITCPANTTLAANASCSSLLGSYSAVAVSDNCTASPAVTQSPASTTILSGHNDVKTVTLTANDGNGNTQACTFTVTLKDITAPSITCPANTTLAANATCSSPLGSYSPLAVSDNCTANPAVTQNPAPSTLLSGHNDLKTVTLTANDGNGNTQACSFTVTLKDITPPTVVCHPFTAALNAAGTTSITTANVYQSGSDNCGTVNQVSVLPNAYSCSNLGPNTVVLTVNDGNGNTSSCQAVVTVVDLIPPTMACNSLTVALNAAGSASITVTQINNNSGDNCTLANLSLTPTSFTCSNLGANTVTLTGTDQSGNTASCQGTVTVIDNIPPTMQCMNATLNLNAAGEATLAVANVNNGSFDNCTITTFTLSQTLFNCTHLGNNLVTLTGTDQSGNSASCTATVTVQDLIPPMAKCKNATVNLNAQGQATVPTSAVNNGSSDNCSFTLSLTPSLFTCSNLGMNTVTLKATDNSGNTNTCTAKVTVKDMLPPTALCKNFTIYLDNYGHATLVPANIDNGSTDNCTIVSRTLFLTNFNCSDIGAPVNNFLTVTDNSGNSATCSSAITVKDAIAPIPHCKNQTVTMMNGFATVYSSVVADTSYDNCSITSFVPVAKTYTAPGTYSLSITMKDFSNNAANCTVQVTVLPNFTNANQTNSFKPGQDDDFYLVVYPNPTSGDALLKFDLPAEQPYEVLLRDANGKVVIRQEDIGVEGENTPPLKTGSLPPGLYFVEFRSAAIHSLARLLIHR